MGSLKSFFSGFVDRNGLPVAIYLLTAVTIWIFVLVVLPQLTMLDFSFRHNLPPPKIGGPEDVYTLEQYRFFFLGNEATGSTFNALDIGVLVKTLVAAVFVTLIDLAICYPVAFLMAQATKVGAGRLLVLALIVPYWINEILRAFAFRILFGATGVINEFGMGVGLWHAPIDFIGENMALYAGLAYAYILLMIFPLYNAIESLDKNQIEAARDMGASWLQVHRRVVIPYAKPGIASGSTMVFMLTAGALAAPQILGGPSSLWFTQIVYQWFNDGGNWPRGSAYAMILLVVCILFVLLVMRVLKVSIGEIGR
ncbi:Putrescine transport system permease protein PotH [Hartmannibacter diazotrophicus]|uniref:Putrescine transport system permease protein PotH n=1 Tax=Hartmannibacter diazotrophicus TaxID=1482074 RepID=A0A2C9D927_9HYPH|nr:ABC transporter permease [Hartmannibacter diazotrophicus]SON56822.1 Putrescine transport system permease protein PotH [Hartmannibacter diazotrophicus]